MGRHEAKRIRRGTTMGAVVLVFACAPASVADTWWAVPPPGVGQWNDVQNWTAGVPTINEITTMSNGGTAIIDQNGTAARVLLIFAPASGSGGVEMTGGTFDTDNGTVITGDGFGHFIQSGGVHTAASAGAGLQLYVGGYVTVPGGKGRYELHGGELRSVKTAPGTGNARLGYGVGAIGEFMHTGGLNSMDLLLGNFGGTGTYDLSGAGIVTSANQWVGFSGTGAFTQSGGSNTTGDLEVGLPAGLVSTYDLSGPSILNVSRMFVGKNGTGLITHAGGSNTVGNILKIGIKDTGIGSYTMSAGDLSVANRLVVGEDGVGTFDLDGGTLSTSSLEIGIGTGSGALDVTSNAASITVTGSMITGANATYTAVPGTTIHMTGSSFENHATQPARVRGLPATTFQFEGGAADTDPFEIAGHDFGADGRGFHANFVLASLHLGGADVGQVQLVDLVDNRPYWPTASQALYIDQLVLSAGSTLDLDGFNLYYRSLVDDGGQLLNGTPQQVNDIWLLGDANGDDVVDVADLGLVGADWHTSTILSDVNHDGSVDIADLALVGANWTPPGGTSAAGASTIPAPTGVCFGSSILLALCGRRQRPADRSRVRSSLARCPTNDASRFRTHNLLSFG